MVDLCLVVKWWSVKWTEEASLWSKMSGIQMVRQVTTLPFEYQTPTLSGIQVFGVQMVTVCYLFGLKENQWRSECWTNLVFKRLNTAIWQIARFSNMVWNPDYWTKESGSWLICAFLAQISSTGSKSEPEFDGQFKWPRTWTVRLVMWHVPWKCRHKIDRIS